MDKLWKEYNPMIYTLETSTNTPPRTTTMWMPSGTQRIHITDVAVYASASGVVQLNTTNKMLGKYFISGTTIIDNLQSSLVGDSAQPLTATVSGTGSYFVRVVGMEY